MFMGDEYISVTVLVWSESRARKREPYLADFEENSMKWLLRHLARSILLIIPLLAVSWWAFTFLLLPYIGGEWTPLLFAIVIIIALFADWIWPIDKDMR